MIHEYVPAASELAYTFGGRDPVAELKPGQVWQIFTQDCFNGAVTTVDIRPSEVCQLPYLNPVTGPFFVPGAEVGDILAVHFADMRPARAWGVSSTFPHFGAVDIHPRGADLAAAGHVVAVLGPLAVDGGLTHPTARGSRSPAEAMTLIGHR